MLLLSWALLFLLWANKLYEDKDKDDDDDGQQSGRWRKLRNPGRLATFVRDVGVFSYLFTSGRRGETLVVVVLAALKTKNGP